MIAMKNIFVYGSLMFEEVWGQLTHNQYHKMDAHLKGFIRLKVKGEEYPGIIPSPDNQVTGHLYINVCSDDIEQLDSFEGELYQRSQVIVLSDGSEYKADTYIFKSKYQTLLSGKEWDAGLFKEKGLKNFLKKYGYFNQQQ
jgi:gamma-glutamylcyclotransferase (GGCT)/AIG2-like uncharacterized protein YtfP